MESALAETGGEGYAMDQPKEAHWQQNHLLQHGRAFYIEDTEQITSWPHM